MSAPIECVGCEAETKHLLWDSRDGWRGACRKCRMPGGSRARATSAHWIEVEARFADRATAKKMKAEAKVSRQWKAATGRATTAVNKYRQWRFVVASGYRYADETQLTFDDVLEACAKVKVPSRGNLRTEMIDEQFDLWTAPVSESAEEPARGACIPAAS